MLCIEPKAVNKNCKSFCFQVKAIGNKLFSSNKHKGYIKTKLTDSKNDVTLKRKRINNEKSLISNKLQKNKRNQSKQKEDIK